MPKLLRKSNQDAGGTSHWNLVACLFLFGISCWKLVVRLILFGISSWKLVFVCFYLELAVVI